MPKPTDTTKSNKKSNVIKLPTPKINKPKPKKPKHTNTINSVMETLRSLGPAGFDMDVSINARDLYELVDAYSRLAMEKQREMMSHDNDPPDPPSVA